ncbi:MAG: nitroreductase family protein [Emergencia sp.]
MSIFQRRKGSNSNRESESFDAGLASSYMELMAESLGLGVLYSGFFVAAVRLGKEIRQELGLDKEEQVVSCLVLGYPDVGYQRIVPRRPAKIKMK